MSAPCPHCGGTKTDPVPTSRTFVYLWARHLGYEVRQCGRCRHLRWMDPDEFHKHAAQVAPPPLRPASSRDWPNLTPPAPDVEQAHRESAGVPTAVAEPPAFEKGELPVTAAVAVEEPPATAAIATPPQLETETEDGISSAPAVPQPGAQPAASASQRQGACPQCGSAQYRRSHRRLLEKLMLRGAMARCRECECRFPLPRARRRVQGSEQ